MKETESIEHGLQCQKCGYVIPTSVAADDSYFLRCNGWRRCPICMKEFQWANDVALKVITTHRRFRSPSKTYKVIPQVRHLGPSEEEMNQQQQDAYNWWKENQDRDFDSMSIEELIECVKEQDRLYCLAFGITEIQK